MSGTKKIISQLNAKYTYQGKDLNSIVIHFTDEVFDIYGNLVENVSGKGILNNKINAFLMNKLNSIGIHTHFMKDINMKEQAIRFSDPFEMVVKVTNVTSPELASKFNLIQGMILRSPVAEFYAGNHAIPENLTTDDQLVYFGVVDPFEMEEIRNIALRTNDYLGGMLSAFNIRLASIELRFAKAYDDEIARVIIADEITPDTMRLLDLTTNEVLDASAYSNENPSDVYIEVAKRLSLIKPVKKTVKKLS